MVFFRDLEWKGLCGDMEVELVTDETSDDENYGFDDNSEDYLNLEGERCGICMDVVIDRGVLDCCQHWFCFACIDNWATITSLCPLCQNEFQLITCVPVYDTVGGNKTDDDTNPRDDDWFIEGKNNSLSFPSYYIDENAVACLDGDGCKIRSGSVAVEEDSDIDTSIACDSCDKWYHAFCVGFDPEGTCDSSWLCPRCTRDKGPHEPDSVSILRNTYQNGLEIAGGDSLTQASFSGRVSVSVADDGETAVVVSLLEGNQESQESSQSVLGCSKDMGNTLLSSSISSIPSEKSPRHLNKKTIDSGLGLDLSISMGSDTPVDMKDNNIAEDKVHGSSEPNNRSEDLLPVVSSRNTEAHEIEVSSLKSVIPDEKVTISGITGAKRKCGDSRNVDDGEREVNTDARCSRKKIKTERNGELISLTAQSVQDNSGTIFNQSSSRDSTIGCTSKKENGTFDIMDIVQGTDRRSLKQPGHKNSSDITPNERESAAGLRLKKIMRRAGDDKDSLVLVQELRKKIKAAVRNKSSKELGQNLYDPKLLDAFRAALAGSGAENRKPTLDVKAKRSLLQKGKIRESLTKKIYGTGGKRKRAWTRECEVEFWKHRCIKTSKPEKIQTLKSVLDLLRDNSDVAEKMPVKEEEAKGSILSRLYLADTSVFPRKNDIIPVSSLKAVVTPVQKRESGTTENVSTMLPDRNSQKHNSLSQFIVPLLDGKGTTKSVKGVNSETAPNKDTKKSVKDVKIPSEKEKASKLDTVKGDKRQWALELLARKTAASGKNMQEKEEDNTILKGNYTLLAILQSVKLLNLTPSNRNKLLLSRRQKLKQEASVILSINVVLNTLLDHCGNTRNKRSIIRFVKIDVNVGSQIIRESIIVGIGSCRFIWVSLYVSSLLIMENWQLEFASEIDSAYQIIQDVRARVTADVAWLTMKAYIDMENIPYNLTNVYEFHDAITSAGMMRRKHWKDIISVNDVVEKNALAATLFRILAANDDNVWKALYHKDFTLEQDSVTPTNGWKAYYAATRAVVITNDQFFRIIRERSPRAMDQFWLNADYVKCFHLRYYSGYNAVMENWQLAFALEIGSAYQIIQDVRARVMADVAWVTMKAYLEMDNLPYNLTNVYEFHDGRWFMDLRFSYLGFEEEPSLLKKTRKNFTCTHLISRLNQVEAYIKEHIRPLCKSGVITVEQYRWAVGKTTEKVMKYHSKEKNANFLIKVKNKNRYVGSQYWVSYSL
ncbi:hypothetical protein DH2020_049245 [Rehmannia glutinosa]|uniref:RING-type domain-containing protein n=1 Tax=Rehmannia glutinosa TaxID=99300 RepID=A0ABR0U3X9_REHGL